MINSYHNKIIFFLHFHKCGGTTINSLFNHFNNINRLIMVILE